MSERKHNYTPKTLHLTEIENSVFIVCLFYSYDFPNYSSKTNKRENTYKKDEVTFFICTNVNISVTCQQKKSTSPDLITYLYNHLDFLVNLSIL